MFLRNLLNVLVQIANRMGLQKKHALPAAPFILPKLQKSLRIEIN
jgi:hypothetical protein